MDDDRGESDVGMLVVRLVIPAHTSWPPCDALVGVASVLLALSRNSVWSVRSTDVKPNHKVDTLGVGSSLQNGTRNIYFAHYRLPVLTFSDISFIYIYI